MIVDVITENPNIHAAFGRQPKCLPGQTLFNFEHRCDNCLLLNLSIYNVYVSRIGQISGHMTLTIVTFPSTTPKIHCAR